MSDGQSNVLWPERFRVPVMDSEEAEELEREVTEWDALISAQPHIQRLLSDLRALQPDALYYIQRIMFGAEGNQIGV
jgi:hypothetical protein